MVAPLYTPSDHDFDLLSAYLDGELSSREAEALEQRLREDPVLVDVLDDLRATVALLNDLPPLKAPRNFTLDPVLYSRPMPWWQRLFSLENVLQLSGALGAVASILLIVGTLLLQSSGADELNYASEAEQLNSQIPLTNTALYVAYAQTAQALNMMSTATQNAGIIAESAEQPVEPQTGDELSASPLPQAVLVPTVTRAFTRTQVSPPNNEGTAIAYDDGEGLLQTTIAAQSTFYFPTDTRRTSTAMAANLPTLRATTAPWSPTADPAVESGFTADASASEPVISGTTPPTRTPVPAATTMSAAGEADSGDAPTDLDDAGSGVANSAQAPGQTGVVPSMEFPQNGAGGDTAMEVAPSASNVTEGSNAVQPTPTTAETAEIAAMDTTNTMRDPNEEQGPGTVESEDALTLKALTATPTNLPSPTTTASPTVTSSPTSTPLPTAMPAPPSHLPAPTVEAAVGGPGGQPLTAATVPATAVGQSAPAPAPTEVAREKRALANGERDSDWLAGVGVITLILSLGALVWGGLRKRRA